MTYLLEKEINGMYRRAMFHTSIHSNEPCVSYSLINKRGTYNRNLGTTFFNSKDEGNEKYKSLIAEGYKVISKW